MNRIAGKTLMRFQMTASPVLMMEMLLAELSRMLDGFIPGRLHVM
jgi:hypothetical protein